MYSCWQNSTILTGKSFESFSYRSARDTYDHYLDALVSYSTKEFYGVWIYTLRRTGVEEEKERERVWLNSENNLSDLLFKKVILIF
jgi:hypothetical protein